MNLSTNYKQAQMCGRFKCGLLRTAVDTDAFNTSPKDTLFFLPSSLWLTVPFAALCSHPFFRPGRAGVSGPWWTARSSGPNITCSLSPGAWWREDNWQQALFIFPLLSFLPHFLQPGKTSSGGIKVCLSKSQQRPLVIY